MVFKLSDARTTDWGSSGWRTSVYDITHDFALPATGKAPTSRPRSISIRRLRRSASPACAVVGIGGLGHLAIQYAKAAGFETIAVSHSPEKDQLIGELGVDATVRDGESLGKAGGADVVLAPSVHWRPHHAPHPRTGQPAKRPRVPV